MRPHRDGPRAALTLALCLLAADGAAAQQRYPSGPPGAKEYRLTLVALRKFLPALRADQWARCEQRDAKRDPFAMTLAQMAAALDRCAPVRTALAKTGVSTREAASVLGAFLYAGRRITEEESAKALGQQAVGGL